MSVFVEKKRGAWIVKIRDASGRQVAVAANAKNLRRHGVLFDRAIRDPDQSLRPIGS